MKIETKTGDLLSVPSGHIVHGCNAQGVMGSGVALAVKNKWPAVFVAYQKEYRANGLPLGSVHSVHVEPDVFVWNAITQNLFGRSGFRFVSYDAIQECFEQINEHVGASAFKEIHIPLIGAGLGGGNWEIIREIIEQTVTHPTTLWVLPA
jgi:O-acetyl-ADP-ribose deacetylase (regulator of RNase III)